MTKDIIKKYGLSDDRLDALVNQICSAYDESAFAELMHSGVPAYVNIESIRPWDLVTGTVTSLSGGTVLVEFGHKSEGILPYREGDRINDDLDIGDIIQVLIKETKKGRVLLTRVGVDRLVREDTTVRSLSPGDRIRGEISQQTKAGWLVTINGCLSGFLPHPTSGFSLGTNLDSLATREVFVEVVSVDVENRQVVLTRRAIAEEERRLNNKNYLANLEAGQLVEGVVKNITDFGVFIQLAPNITGLCFKTEIGRTEVEINQKVTAKVLKVDRSKSRVSLGIRQASEPSWEEVIEKYTTGDCVTGVITSITEYGPFVEIEPGLTGLVHISEISWLEQIEHPADVLSVGQEIEAVVLEVETDRRRISLSIKRLNPNPWDLVESRYLIGSVVSGQVTAVKDFGVFVELEKGIDGLVKTSNAYVMEGDKVDVIISRINARVRKIDLKFC